MVPKKTKVKKNWHTKTKITTPLRDLKRRPRAHGETNYLLSHAIACNDAFRLVCMYEYVRIDTWDGTNYFSRKTTQHASPGHDASTAEAAPGRAERIGVGENNEDVSGREVSLIAFPREKG